MTKSDDDLKCFYVPIVTMILAFNVLVFIVLPIIDRPPDPVFSVRLVGVEGLDHPDPCHQLQSAAPAVPPVFDLAVDVGGVPPRYRACGGGGGDDTVLRVSLPRLSILAWGCVPSFCIDGGEHGRARADGVVVVRAEAGACAAIRDGLRNLIWTERRVLGKVDFDVEGNLGKVSSTGLATNMFRWARATYMHRSRQCSQPAMQYLVLMAPIIDGPPDPSFSVRLVGVEGLDVDADARLSGPRSSSPAALPGLRRGQGRHRAARLVPRHDGIVLARAPVPSFCIDGKLLEGGGAVGVVVVKAEAAAANAKMRKGLRDLIWTERRVLGKVDFDVEGNLGEQVTRDDLNCKVSSFEGAKGRFESI
ncbi:hypothetical protein OsI_03120 [Oryza sativa Indica Group]|uniref:Uncharacterized protein n=1 Tax=Oryza sativa subsp. indica TaxID=39946 RepID=B8A6V3_ORYSI|nr:hypothetical protein OsI_03120 [Oryza sativa Indica Group]